MIGRDALTVCILLSWGRAHADRTSAGTALERQRILLLEETESIVSESQSLRQRLRDRLRSLYRLERSRSGPASAGGDTAARVRHRLARRVLADDLRHLESLAARGKAIDASKRRLARLLAELPLAQNGPRDGAEQPRPLPPDAVGTEPLHGGQEGTLVVHEARDLPFAHRRGHLPFPVRGARDLRLIPRRPGIEIRLSSGGTGVAVASARVEFAASYAGLGKLVILDHGHGWRTLLGGLTTLFVVRGQNVSEGDSLGQAGAPLVFEIRRGDRSEDPMKWLGLR